MSYRAIGSAFCMVLMFATAGLQVAGEEKGSFQAGTLKAWRTSDEIRLGGVIQGVLKKNPPGAPQGLNLEMSGSQNVLNVNLGSALGETTKQALRVGQSIEVVGLVRSFQGTNYLLVRELVLGGQTIEVRSKGGLPVRATEGRGLASPRQRKSDWSGGAR